MNRVHYPEDDLGIFAASRAKLLRARQFIAELVTETKAYTESQPFKGKFIPPEQLTVHYAAITLKPSGLTGTNESESGFPLSRQYASLWECEMG
jgi:hypothetical protein